MTDDERTAIDNIIEGLRPKFWERVVIAILLPLSIFFWVAVIYYGWVILTYLRYPHDSLGG